jgi:glycerol-3-phosphate responsive antiterminator
VIAADQVNEDFERVLKSDVRYRFVIDMASLKLNIMIKILSNSFKYGDLQGF